MNWSNRELIFEGVEVLFGKNNDAGKRNFKELHWNHHGPVLAREDPSNPGHYILTKERKMYSESMITTCEPPQKLREVLIKNRNKAQELADGLERLSCELFGGAPKENDKVPDASMEAIIIATNEYLFAAEERLQTIYERFGI